LKTAVVGIAGGMSIGKVSASKSGEIKPSEKYDSWKETADELTEKYGQNEANIIENIFARETRKYENGVISEKEGIKNAWQNILDHPRVEDAAKDLQGHIEFIEGLDEGVVDNKTEEDVSNLSHDESIYLANHETDGSSPWSGSYESSTTNIYGENPEMECYAGVTGGGTSEFVARFYIEDLTSWTSLSGDVLFDASGFAKGTLTAGVGDASAEVFIFLRTDETMEKKRVENLGQYNGSYNGSASFTIDDSREYDLGVEFQGSASALTHYTYVDYFGTGVDGGSRRVEIGRGGYLHAYEL